MEPYEFAEPQPGRPPRMSARVKCLILVVLTPIIVWLLTGIGVTWWFALQVPVSEQDIAYSSWLGSPTTALHFTGGPFGIAFTVASFLLGMLIAIGRGLPLHGLVFILASIAMGTSLSNESFIRIGLLNGSIKIGCFVPETRECHEQLGLPADSVYSLRASPVEVKAGMGYSQQYLTARGKVVSPELEHAGAILSFPVSPIVIAPKYFGQTEKLKQLLEAQRAEVVAMQRAAAVDGPSQPVAAK